MIIWNGDEFLKLAEHALHGATLRSANIVARKARTKAPWESGELATSITVEESKFKNGGHLVVAQGPGNYDKYYASFVELGTHKMAARPFLRPALKQSKAEILKEFEGIIRD